MTKPVDSIEAVHTDMMNVPGMRDAVSLLTGNMDPRLSNRKGRCWHYHIDEEIQANPRLQQMELERIATEFTHSEKLNLRPEFRYPYATRRFFGVSSQAAN